MPICPRCQHENESKDKFCQRCGISLKDRICNQCGSKIPAREKDCPICNGSIEVIRWAILFEPKAEESNQPEKPRPKKSELPKLLERKYIDRQKRYQLHPTDGKVEFKSSGQFFLFKVLDTRPLQKSFLENLLEQNFELWQELEKNSTQIQELNLAFWRRLGIPTIALPYLKLQDNFPAIPEVRDTWHFENREVLLLPDRSEWHSLSEFWKSEELSLPQIITHIDRMARLWEELSQLGCRQSLLVESNLKVDSKGSFGVQQLYRDPPGTEPTLQNLVRVWQLLWKRAQKSQVHPLTLLLHQISRGNIQTIAELRTRLHNLVRDLKSNFQPLAASETEPETKSFQLIEDFAEEPPIVLLPIEVSSLDDASMTDIGRKRNCNEDCFGVKTTIQRQAGSLKSKIEARGLYIVCDGMGGHDAGEIASAMAVEILQDYFRTKWQDELPDEETLRQGMLSANQSIYRLNQDKSGSLHRRMGTTAVMVLVKNTKVAIVHVGDSRVYRVTRKFGLELLTADHQVGQWEIKRGVEPKIAYARPDAYQLTQALGPRGNEYVRPDTRFLELDEDTLLLLCSDGLSDNDLVETYWETYLAPLIDSKTNLEEGLLALIELANDRNGHDNITGVLVRVNLQQNANLNSNDY